MKEMDLYIKPENLEIVKKIMMDEFECGGLTVVNALGCGNQKGYKEEYRGIKSSVNLLPKLLVIVIVKDEKIDAAIEVLQKRLYTGEYGNGKIVVKDVERVVRIRTGETGEAAI